MDSIKLVGGPLDGATLQHTHDPNKPFIICEVLADKIKTDLLAMYEWKGDDYYFVFVKSKTKKQLLAEYQQGLFDSNEKVVTEPGSSDSEG
jgi:hypothetical protein